MLVDIFGSWCPTCHDAAPALVRLYRKYHARGLEIVGLAYEVTGDSAVDARQVRRYRDKFHIPFPLLLAGINDTEAAARPSPSSWLHLVPDDGLSGARRAGAAGARRILRSGHGCPARAPDPGDWSGRSSGCWRSS